MAKVSATKRTTLYRMVEGCTLDTALRGSRRESDDNFTVMDLALGTCPARLVSGAITTLTKWSSDIGLLTGQRLNLTNSSPGAALLIQDAKTNVWAITWGTGFHFIDSEQIDFGFGTSIVARSALPSEIKSLTKTILDHRARVDRSSMPNGSTVRDLGVDGYGEVVSRVEARAVIPDLTIGEEEIVLRAADSLSLPLAKKSDWLLEDLRVLDELRTKPVLKGLESIEQLTALKARDRRVPNLDRKLRDALHAANARQLGVAWPHERLDTYGPVMSAKVTGFGDHKARVIERAPDINDVLDWLKDVPLDDLLERIGTVRIELHSDPDPGTDTLVSSPVALRRWLAFEVIERGQRFCLYDGNWYRMDDRYLARIDDRVGEILAEPPSLQVPPWPTDVHEDEYNKLAADALAGYCLDRKLITTPLHSRGGIEPCDIFVPPGVLIHVKKGRDSANLSHLLAQGLVSTDALARDENAREAWMSRIAEESGGAVQDAALHEVILVVGDDKPITVETLFTFTKVNLVKQFDALRYLGVKVHVTTALPGPPTRSVTSD